MRKISCFFRFTFVLSLLFMFYCVGMASGATFPASQQYKIIEGGQLYIVTYTIQHGQAIIYANDENCGNSAHKTRKGNRFFSHVHVSYSLPITGVDQNFQQRTVTAPKIKAYWDQYYSNSTGSEGSEDLAVNCWGYALDFDTWVDDPSYIYTDDYQNCPLPEATVEALPAHARKVVDVDDQAEGTTLGYRTKEKNRVSRIYLHDRTAHFPLEDPGRFKKPK